MARFPGLSGIGRMQPPARASTQRRHGVDIERRF
jgi:hypothetical protein